jgi:AcrR family transcriptional regulator
VAATDPRALRADTGPNEPGTVRADARRSEPQGERADAQRNEPRALRADAQRNRDRLLAVAARAFSEDGPEVTLDSIVKEAGVGIGTLYRHFPTREALVEATYRNELARLCDAAGDLLTELPADQATRQWMDGFIDYMTTKRGMADALRAVVASGGDPFAESLARLLRAVTTLLDAGATAGTIRADVQPGDVLASLSGVSLTAGEPAQRDQARRMLDLLMDGLRYRD